MHLDDDDDDSGGGGIGRADERLNKQDADDLVSDNKDMMRQCIRAIASCLVSVDDDDDDDDDGDDGGGDDDDDDDDADEYNGSLGDGCLEGTFRYEQKRTDGRLTLFLQLESLMSLLRQLWLAW